MYPQATLQRLQTMPDFTFNNYPSPPPINHHHWCFHSMRRILGLHSSSPVEPILCRLGNTPRQINCHQLLCHGRPSPCDFGPSPRPFPIWCPEQSFFHDITHVLSRYVPDPPPVPSCQFPLRSLTVLIIFLEPGQGALLSLSLSDSLTTVKGTLLPVEGEIPVPDHHPKVA